MLGLAPPIQKNSRTSTGKRDHEHQPNERVDARRIGRGEACGDQLLPQRRVLRVDEAEPALLDRIDELEPGLSTRSSRSEPKRLRAGCDS